MAKEYDNTNRGVLFLNDSRNAKAPRWRGQCTIQTPDGELVEFWISCWEQESRKGDEFLSLSFEEKDEKRDSRDRDDDRGRGRDRDDDRGRSTSRGRDDDRGRGRDRDDDRDRRSTRSRDDDRDTRGGRDRDDDRRRRDDDRPRDVEKRGTDSDLDDSIPF